MLGTSRSWRDHVIYVDEGSDVLAANEKQTKPRGRAQRTVTKQPQENLPQGHVGDVLRSIYQQTVDETIPDEFLDILGKLA